MMNLDFFNNYTEPVCAFNESNQLIFRNSSFNYIFSDFKSFDKFKKRFNFNLCLLSSENLKNLTPLDIMLKSKENFHTICTYQKLNEEYIYYYIYTFKIDDVKIVSFKDITNENALNSYKNRYSELNKKYNEAADETKKFLKMQEHANSQVLKMAAINRISLVIRETNKIEKILSSALEEINNLFGSYKTYFSVREKDSFKIKYSLNSSEIGILTEYEDNISQRIIKTKDIIVSSCLKEYYNAEDILPKGVTRVIIPVHNKNKLLGIIVTFTKHKFNLEDNLEILQSLSVQLASSIIQSELIQQLDNKNKKLEKTLNELKETQLQLINTEKMASVGQLVSGVAHEINTPLASIKSNNSIIEKIISSQNNLNEEKTRLIKELNSINTEASKRIYDIVKSLKRFVRLDEAEFQQADINSELDLTLKLMAHELKNNINVVKDYSKLPVVTCSVNMLNQVFMNLLVNACHALQEKGGGTITITTSYNDKNVYIKIKDDGIGIKSDIQSKIFNASFTTKKIGIGTGLGLAISKKIIDLHKGTITFTSKENVGSEFTVCVPIKPLH